MQLHRLSLEDYANVENIGLRAFDSPSFISLNASKAEAIALLLFEDGKKRFALAGGIRDDWFVSPFSAPYGGLQSLRSGTKIQHYYGAVDAFTEWLTSEGLKGARISCPPALYQANHINHQVNALTAKGFKVASCELNHAFDLTDFDAEKYPASIDIKSRQKLRAAQRGGLQVRHVDLPEFETVYGIIERNRSHRGFPLHLSAEDLKATLGVVPGDMFLCQTADGKAVASGIVFHITKSIVQVIYWGNEPGTENVKPMNMLAFSVFEHYARQGKQFVDIGPSSEDGEANFGLSEFKQGIGCQSDLKWVMSYEV